MPRPILSSAALVARGADPEARLRLCIARLVREPAVARMVGRRLAHRGGVPPVDMVGLLSRPACRGSVHCGRLDCLCGRYPRRLTETEIRRAGLPERAVG